MTSSVEWLEAVANGVWQGVVLVAVTASGLRLAGHRLAASSRYAIWWTTLQIVVLLPVWVVVQPDQVAGSPGTGVAERVDARSPWSPATTEAGSPGDETRSARSLATSANAARVVNGERVLRGPSTRVSADDEAASTDPDGRGAGLPDARGMAGSYRRGVSSVVSLNVPRSLPAVLAVAHVAVVMVLLGFVVHAIVRVRRLRATMRLMPPELRGLVARLRGNCAVGRPVRVGVSDAVTVPITLGFLDPVVLLPSTMLTELEAGELSQVIVHELAHVARRDDWARLAQRVLGALFFFHPAVHWSSRRLELERELACDERVLAHTGVARPHYASCLLRVGELAAGAPSPPAVALSMASQLRARVESLLAAREQAVPRSTRTVACAMLILAGAAVAIGAIPAVNVAVSSTSRNNHSGTPTAADPLPTDAAVRLRKLLYGYEAFGFHGGVLIVHRGEVLVREGFGMADRAMRRRWTPETAFNGGAVAKMLTAAAILKLEEQGRLSVGDRVADHLGPFPQPKAGVTIHHLLTHTGGLARQWAPIDRTDRVDFVDAMRSTPADYAAGRGHRYTDHGHALLAAIIETASGMSYEQYVRTELLEPAGMIDTRFENEAPTSAPVAVEYTRPAGSDSRLGARPYSWGRRGAMGVVTTLDDLLSWHLAILDGRIFSDAARTRMFTPRLDVGRNTQLAYGWEVGRSSRGTRIRHRLSAWPGNSVEMVYDEDEDLFIALVANEPADWGRPKYLELFNAAFGLQHLTTPAPHAVKQHELDPLAGRYLMDGTTIDVRPAGPGTLRIDAWGDRAPGLFSAQPATIIARATADRVFTILQWSRHRMIELRFDAPDTVRLLVSGVTYTATRID